MSSVICVFVFLSLCSVYLMQCTPGIYHASEGCGPPKLDASYMGGKNLGTYAKQIITIFDMVYLFYVDFCGSGHLYFWQDGIFI